jgi:hypothetical protein
MDAPRPEFVQPSAGRMGRAASPMLWLALVLALPCGQVTCAQQSSTNGSSQQTTHPLHSAQPDADQNATSEMGGPLFQERRLRQLSAAQHKAMVSDTDKLLKLVTELNAEINSKTPNTLTPEQLRKVVEIEKLAHSVRDKMRTTVQGASTFLDAAPPELGRQH